MSQNKYKCSGKDVEKSELQYQQNPKKDVELCLEVEMDDEVRQIITSPEKCASTLLDVTVIKPKDLDHLYCSHKTTLSGDEVKKLIASTELEKQDKQKLIDKLLSSGEPKSSGDYVKKKYVKKLSNVPRDRQRISTTDDTTSDLAYNYKHKPNKKNDNHVQQIYTTAKTYRDIRSIFTCKNKHKFEENEKPDRPCLCRNCAIVGVLTDSQKKPFITENLYDPRDLISSSRKEPKDCKKKKYVNFKDGGEDHTECEYYFRHLSAKIRRLEERLAIQEEKSVPRDYFKRIITKLVNHLSKITNYAGNEPSHARPKSRDNREPYKPKERYGDNKYYIHPVLIDTKLDKDIEFEEFLNNPTLEVDDKYRKLPDGFWKWGEEILKPGIDLKNKIVMLLEDTLSNLKKPRSVPSRLGKTLSNFEPPQKIPVEIPVRDVSNKKNVNSSKNSPNVYNSHSVSSLTRPKKCRSSEKRGRKAGQGKQIYEESLNVSYLNPQMRRWQEESQVSFKLESSDMDSLRYSEERRLNEAYKAEFKETLQNTKESDKLKLWHSVWAQAKINGQSRSDKVTIQLPERKNIKSDRTIEIEYTISELEELLLGSIRSSYRQGSRKRGDRK